MRKFHFAWSGLLSAFVRASHNYMLPLLLRMGDHIDNLIIKPRLCYCRWENITTYAQCGASLSRSNIAMTDPMCDPCIQFFAIAMIDQ